MAVAPEVGRAEGLPCRCASAQHLTRVAAHSVPYEDKSSCLCVPRQLPLPPALYFQLQVEGSSIDFIKHNARNAKRAPLRRSHSLQALSELLGQKQREQEEYNAKQKGHVPQ